MSELDQFLGKCRISSEIDPDHRRRGVGTSLDVNGARAQLRRKRSRYPRLGTPKLQPMPPMIPPEFRRVAIVSAGRQAMAQAGTICRPGRRVMLRPDGVEVHSMYNRAGRLVRRTRRGLDGREVVLIDDLPPGLGSLDLRVTASPLRGLAAGSGPLLLTDHVGQDLVTILLSPPRLAVERPYRLEEIRRASSVRDLVPAIELDTVHFDYASWTLAAHEVERLREIASALRSVLAQHPQEIFLIEGHTDAAGSDEYNLELSDRRAETVARILAERFGVPAENLVTQGYGEEFLKVATDQPEPRNRRVVVRRITSLLWSGHAPH